MKYWIGFFAVLACVLPQLSRAATGLVITEIMYDPSGTDTNREWIEIYNGGATSIDISGIVLLTDGVPSTHHTLAPVGASSLAPNTTAVIVQNPTAFKTEYPGFAGLLFDSSWTGLTTTAGKTIALLDAAGGVLDQVTYDPTIGAANDGNSLQRMLTGEWVARSATPGVYPGDTGTTTTKEEQSNESPTVSTATSKESSEPVSQAHAELVVAHKAVAGIPLRMTTKVFGYNNEPKTTGVFYISFGDGEEYRGDRPEILEHTYTSAGAYVVVFEYRSNQYQIDPDLATRVVVEVADPAVAVTAVSSDGSVELTNTGSREVDMSLWHLHATSRGGAEYLFTIPSSTKILAGKKISIAGRVTHFLNVNPASVYLTLPAGIVVSRFITPASKPAVVTKQPIIKKQKASEKVEITPVQNAPSVPHKRSVFPYILGGIGILIGAVIALVRAKLITTQADKSEDTITIIE